MRRGLAGVLVFLLVVAGLTVAGAQSVDAAVCSIGPTGGAIPQAYGGRPYRIQVPYGLTGPAPLVLSLHGLGGNPQLHASDTQWPQFAATRGFIVAFPSGQAPFQYWDFSRNSPDVAYIRGLVNEIASKWCVDPRRIHATGHSNGALMSMRLACDMADVFGSIAEYAGGPPTASGTPCLPSRPISVGIFSSTFDFLSLVPFGWVTRDQWVKRNGCVPTPQTEAGVLLEAKRYFPCAAGAEVVWRAYLLQSHNWPSGADGNDIRQRMWDLFVRNPLPA